MAFVIVSETTTRLGTEMKIMIESAADLTALPECAPDSKAFTADRSLYYVKDATGHWDPLA